MAQGHELDKEHLAKELGDIAWYLAQAATALEIPLEDIMQANIDKLKKRYSEGFETKRALVRLQGDL
jgi:NTP pyrophosphatase (non-canonical NTP hydrolase)